MQKIAKFLVDRRYLILAVVLVLAAVSGILATKVGINSDMSKYLPDDSNMRAGIDIMDSQFPSAEESGAIRVMFTGLSDAQKADVLEELKAIQHVDNVQYEAGSSDYNNGDHTLYIVNFLFGYDTSEAASVEQAVQTGFQDLDMVYHVDNDSYELPFTVILLALAILMIILFLMSASWLEPFLFLAAIGVSIVLNMGTNIFLGSVSHITYSIAAILQLVLSMDYSIMLINRYRQELVRSGDPKDAMKRALANAFSSITSSSVTTIVGLLMLCFMSFTIGMDLGIVLAKGVLLSLLCIFTLLPALILAFHNGIQKTAKKALHFRMDALGRISNRLRYVSTGTFVVIFIGVLILSQHTQLAYILSGEDPTETYFSKNSAIVVVYPSSAQGSASELAAQAARNPAVTSIQSYSTTLGKEYTAAELAEQQTGTKDAGLDFDRSLLDILYYDYHRGDAAGAMTASAFIRFVSGPVLDNASFAGRMDGAMTGEMAQLEVFADPANLTRPLRAEEIAGFFGMDPDAVSQLFLLYAGLNGDSDGQTLSAQDFVGFLRDSVLTNTAFSGRFTAEEAAALETAGRIIDAVVSGKS